MSTTRKGEIFRVALGEIQALQLSAWEELRDAFTLHSQVAVSRQDAEVFQRLCAMRRYLGRARRASDALYQLTFDKVGE